jgi:hypothetical protein
MGKSQLSGQDKNWTKNEFSLSTCNASLGGGDKGEANQFSLSKTGKALGSNGSSFLNEFSLPNAKQKPA